MWGFSGKSRDSFRFRDHQGSRLGTSCFCFLQLNNFCQILLDLALCPRYFSSPGPICGQFFTFQKSNHISCEICFGPCSFSFVPLLCILSQAPKRQCVKLKKMAVTTAFDGTTTILDYLSNNSPKSCGCQKMTKTLILSLLPFSDTTTLEMSLFSFFLPPCHTLLFTPKHLDTIITQYLRLLSMHNRAVSVGSVWQLSAQVQSIVTHFVFSFCAVSRMKNLLFSGLVFFEVDTIFWFRASLLGGADVARGNLWVWWWPTAEQKRPTGLCVSWTRNFTTFKTQGH